MGLRNVRDGDFPIYVHKEHRAVKDGIDVQDLADLRTETIGVAAGDEHHEVDEKDEEPVDAHEVDARGKRCPKVVGTQHAEEVGQGDKGSGNTRERQVVAHLSRFCQGSSGYGEVNPRKQNGHDAEGGDDRTVHVGLSFEWKNAPLRITGGRPCKPLHQETVT